jgi:DNA-directed RNA polymerase specialized sigma24 family protein
MSASGETPGGARLARIAELDERRREPLGLRFIEDHSIMQIAERSGEPVGTVQARLAPALPVLLKCIERRTGGSV